MIYSYLKNLKPKFFAKRIDKIIFPHCQTLLDLGCGENSVVQFFNKKLKNSTGVDIFLPAINRSKQKKIHNRYIVDNLTNVRKHFKSKSYDCVLLADVIEHFKKTQAISLINQSTQICKKYIIIKTPNGFLKQKKLKGNSYQTHLCHFSVKELKKMGYRVKGIDGLKFLRGELAEIKYKPKIIFSIISNLTEPLLYNFPDLSFSLFAYKKLHY